jgi:hypothetical protein
MRQVVLHLLVSLGLLLFPELGRVTDDISWLCSFIIIGETSVYEGSSMLGCIRVCVAPDYYYCFACSAERSIEIF